MDEKIERVYAYKLAACVVNHELDFNGCGFGYRSFWRLIDGRVSRGKRPTLSLLFPLLDSYSHV